MTIRLNSAELTALHFDERAGAAQRHALSGIDRSRLLDEAAARAPHLVRTGDGLAAAGEVLVSGPARDLAVTLLRRRGFGVVERAGTVVRTRHPSAAAADVEGAVAELRAAGVAAGPNYAVVAAAVGKFACALPVPVDPASAPAERPADSPDGQGVRVAVIDTEIDPAACGAAHGWLAGAPARRALPAGSAAAGHGTFVAGIVRQLAPGCAIVALPALDTDGLGTDFSVARELFGLAAQADPPEVVTLALNSLADPGAAPVAMAAALSAVADRHPHVLMVAAAGNEGTAQPTWPAAAKAVLAVGAHTGAVPSPYANHGPWVDFSTAADGVVSTHGDGFAAWTGTSFAAAQLAGLLAVLRGRGLRPHEAVGRLRTGAVPVASAG